MTTTTVLADLWGLAEHRTWLRGQRPAEPVWYDEKLGLWQVWGYREVCEVLNDPARYSTDSARLFEVDEESRKYFAGDIAQMDGPDHIHMRRQVGKLLTPKHLGDLEERVRETAVELLDRLGDRDRFDLIHDFIDEVSGILFSKIIGTPVEGRKHLLRVNATMDVDAHMSTSGQEGEEYFSSMLNPLQPLRDFLSEVIEERMREPQEDLLSLMLDFRYLDGRKMPHHELVNFAIAVLGAGHVTSPILIGNTMLCLDAFPEQAAKIKADPSLIPSMFEETMRFFSPASTSYRVTEADVVLAGKQIPKDSLVCVQLGAANRDPLQFPDPETYDVTRSPNQHVGYGRGPHYCIGVQLARVEVRTVFNALMDRYPNLRLDPDLPPVFYGSPEFTGVRSLPVRTS
ncbi:cytochrome P450 [Streptomyces venezuelae]|uniref:cytochrome P450 n=1 Tax=Streptomyces venezuelae TaxID=54571 RepID=UPI001238EBB0|nr:cytochrome P450 [Streptomyces venezuelae]